MRLRFAVRRREGEQPYGWVLSVNDVTVTGTTRLSRRETRFLCSLIRTAIREQRLTTPPDYTVPADYVDLMKEEMARKQD